MNILSIKNLSKNFGEKKVIDGISFDVAEGMIYGFLGQNGAGKTTTMKMVLGLLKPDDGKIFVCGEEVSFGETKTNRNVGFLPDVPEFYSYMRPKEYLTLCGEITGIEKGILKNRIQELLILVGLEKENKKIAGFSRGMKQRLGIAQALLNQPKLLICDEPTSALDPIGRKEILDIFLSIKSKTTILFSTHILSDVERICDQVAVLHNSKLALNGPLEDLKTKSRLDEICIEFNSEAELNKFVNDGSIALLKGSFEVKHNSVTMKSDNLNSSMDAIYQAITLLKIYPKRIEIIEPSLENLFLEAVK